MKTRYNCAKCPGYCCSYPEIEITAEDVERLAAHLDLSVKKTRKRFTKKIKDKKKRDGDEPQKPVALLRHQEDAIFGSICTFFDTAARRCGVYEGRPEVCRRYPGRATCGYYEFLKFERAAQKDPEFIALTGN